MKILLTGASGFLGSWLLRDLQGAGHEVVALTRGQADLMHKDQIAAQISKFVPETIVHAAGLVGGIQANISHSYEFLLTNTVIGFNLVAASLELEIKNFINFSSSCIYPPEEPQPFREKQILTGPLEITNEGYALAKINVQKLMDYASGQFGVNYKTLIPSNLYGPNDNFQPGSSHMLAAAILKIKNACESGSPIVQIWGDGSARREFTFVGDLSDWVSNFAINNISSLPNNLNVGSGVDYSIKEYYETIAEVLGYKGVFEFDTERPVGMKQKLMNSDVALEMGWNPSTSLPQGIKITTDWMEHNGK
jgi:GDP-L-fucose synthase